MRQERLLIARLMADAFTRMFGSQKFLTTIFTIVGLIIVRAMGIDPISGKIAAFNRR